MTAPLPPAAAELLALALRLFLIFGVAPFAIGLAAGAISALRGDRERELPGEPDPLLSAHGRAGDAAACPITDERGGAPPQKGCSLNA